MLNHITIHGRLTHEPELRTTPSSVSVCSFTVAVDRSYTKQGEEKQVDFFTVIAWRGLGEMVAKYFCKGKEILVSGEMQSRKWQDKDGNNRISWEIMADSVDFCGSKGDSSNNGHAVSTSEPTAPIVADFAEVKAADGDLPF